jgi:VanZ family protein
MMAFAAMGGALCIGYPRHRASIALLVLGAVGLLEMAQHLVPGRHGEIHDGIVKASGAFLGALAAIVIDRRKEGP